MEQQNHDGGGGQNDQGWFEQPCVEVRIQVSVPKREQKAMERLRHQAWSLDRGEVP